MMGAIMIAADAALAASDASRKPRFLVFHRVLRSGTMGGSARCMVVVVVVDGSPSGFAP